MFQGEKFLEDHETIRTMLMGGEMVGCWPGGNLRAICEVAGVLDFLRLWRNSGTLQPGLAGSTGKPIPGNIVSTLGASW